MCNARLRRNSQWIHVSDDIPAAAAATNSHGGIRPLSSLVKASRGGWGWDTGGGPIQNSSEMWQAGP